MQIPSGWSGAELAGSGLGGTGMPGGVPTLRGDATGYEPGTLAVEPGLTTGGGEGLGTPVAPNGYHPTEPQPGPTFRPLPGGLAGPTIGRIGPGTTGGVLLSALNPMIVVAYQEGEVNPLAEASDHFGKDLEYWESRVSGTSKRFDLVVDGSPSAGIDRHIELLETAAATAGEAEWACFQAARAFGAWESFWDLRGEPGLAAQAKAVSDEYDRKADLWAERRRAQERKAAAARRVRDATRGGPRSR